MRKLDLLVIASVLLAGNILSAQSWVIGPFMRPSEKPLIEPNPSYYFTDPITQQKTFWAAGHTFNPAAAIAPDGNIAVIFRAEDKSGNNTIGGHVSRLGLAISSDGLSFTVEGAPVLYMENDEQKTHEFPGGVEDPRIVIAPDGTYVMTYTQWARDQGHYTVGIATSQSLEVWKKWGPAFGNLTDSHHIPVSYKSAGILTELHNGRLRAARLHGHYWMYWGEIQIHLATSSDLIHWSPVMDSKTGLPITLMSARAGHFDSGFPEVGPPPILTNKGIVLIYNGKNLDEGTADARISVVAGATKSDSVHDQQAGDSKIAPGAYSVGEALFSKSDPAKLLARTDRPVLTPVWPYERSGQYGAGTTFAEGLVLFHGQWLLYYGAADSAVGVVRAEMR